MALQVPDDLPPALTSGRRLLWATGGWLAATLALGGLLLPLVPTTPFVLVAASCFSRSSPRAHAWLLGNRWFGPLLTQWHETRSVPRSAKLKGYFVLLFTFGGSIAFAPLLLVKAGLALLGTGLLIFLYRLPETP